MSEENTNQSAKVEEAGIQLPSAKQQSNQVQAYKPNTNDYVDIEAVNPKNGDKLSPNLYRWLTHRTNREILSLIRVYLSADGLYIGIKDEDWFHGCKLMNVLSGGPSAYRFATPFRGMTEVAGFWRSYESIGRCAIDPAHTIGFAGDETRWSVKGDTRTCNWCKNHSQKRIEWVESVLRSKWEPVAQVTDEVAAVEIKEAA